MIVFVSKSCAGVQHLSHWLDVADVDLLELIDVAEDAIELASVGVHFLGRQTKMGQFGDSQHFFATNFHGGFDFSAACVSKKSLLGSVTGRRGTGRLFSWFYITFYSARVSIRILRVSGLAEDRPEMVGSPCGVRSLRAPRRQCQATRRGQPAAAGFSTDAIVNHGNYLRGNAWQCKRQRLWTFFWTGFAGYLSGAASANEGDVLVVGFKGRAGWTGRR